MTFICLALLQLLYFIVFKIVIFVHKRRLANYLQSLFKSNRLSACVCIVKDLGRVNAS